MNISPLLQSPNQNYRQWPELQDLIIAQLM